VPKSSASKLPDPLSHRSPDHEIESIFPSRWSPRAMTGAPVSPEERSRLLEAARWAPSSRNEQEWRFLYAHREGEHWPLFLGLLVEANRVWCERAGLLLLLASRRLFERNGKPNAAHSLDAGAAMQNLLLQGTAMGLVTHPMAGFDRERSRSELRIPEDHAIEAMIAVGRPGDPARLPADLQEREVPSGRRPIEEFSCEGPFSL